MDSSDEWCGEFAAVYKYNFDVYNVRIPPPAVIDFDGMGNVVRKRIQSQDHVSFTVCPETHFQCPDGGYCLPVYVRCNGVPDCPDMEDEAECESYTCPGFYRCRGSRVCLHASHTCDGWPQCPQQDDEQFCDLNFTCPENCTCDGLAFRCRGSFILDRYRQVRYVDATGSGLPSEFFVNFTMLVYLKLSSCNLQRFENLALPNLRTLDLRDNQLRTISSGELSLLTNLQMLILADNPLESLFASNTSVSFSTVQVLDLFSVKIRELNVSNFLPFANLRILNLSNSGLDRVLDGGFQSLPKLRELDVTGCSMSLFPRDLLQGLTKLQYVRSDNYRLCCSVVLPDGFDPNKCTAPFDELSSCAALLRSDEYRISLAVLATMALVGNLFSFLARVLVIRNSGKSGYSVFVINLCVSDFLMGVYLVVTGVADLLYQGSYLWNDLSWRNSFLCQTAGFLSLLSSEVSALIICLITVDRFLAIRFPFSQLHFNGRTSHYACLVAWVTGIIIAAVPLLPVTSHWSFYSQTGICIPLPITKNDFPGHQYAFNVMIVFNFIVFLLIAVGQASVYSAVSASVLTTSDSSRKSQELVIAHRLLVVVVSDFLCWFPIGLLGLLVSAGTAVPGEVNVAMAIFVLPLNSALNPFLYTLNMIQERRHRAREKKLLKLINERTNKAR